jgi:tRNA dimethylallyltransferase
MLVIIGATASGKSELAMEVARRTGAEILSVDSMQVYRHMNVGTAKPAPAEREKVPHHLIDVVDPSELFTAARFVQLADEAIADAAQRRVPLIATGGTPMYFKALFQGMFEGPSANPALRDRLRLMGNQALHQKLLTIDPDAAQRIHVNDTMRLVRAIEVHELTGQSITSLQQEWSRETMRHPAQWIGLDWDREVLNRRINARMKTMMDAGWLEETRSLLDRYGQLSRTASEATGYQELIEHLQGKKTLEEATEQIKIATRQLARRQMKWFRRFPNVHWMSGPDDLQKKLDQTLALWHP